ncbi:S8 family peptidase [Kyrpidia sp.]|uniref:S8 family peptidase n=1 Tax=Kyrpidia sp. TaxID=2073077 RepID=UPI0025860897|nr:S8 family peptidase [Kyrpidia sp.]
MEKKRKERGPRFLRVPVSFALIVALLGGAWWAGGGVQSPGPGHVPSQPPLSHTPYSAAQIASRDVAVTASLTVSRARKDMADAAAALLSSPGPGERTALLADRLSPRRGYLGAVWLPAGGPPAATGSSLSPTLLREVENGTTQSSAGWYVGPARQDEAGRLYSPAGLRLDGGLLAVKISLASVHRVAAEYEKSFGALTSLHAPGGRPQVLTKGNPGSLSSAPGGVGSSKGLAGKDVIHTQSAVDGTDWHVRGGQGRPAPRVVHRDGEWIVHFGRVLGTPELEDLQRASGGRVVNRDGRGGYVFRFARPSDMNRAAPLFRAKGARYIERHGVARINRTPDDPLYRPYQWNMPMIDAENAWRTTTGAPGIVVAVVDTGVDRGHPDLQGQLLPGANLLDPTRPPDDDNGHGTHVAGVIAALSNNGEGVASLDWHGRVLPVKVLDQDGAGSAFDVARGIIWATDHGARVINLSLGQTEDCQYLHDAIRYAAGRGVLVVAAMGNEGTDTPEYPAAYPEVLAVTAVDPGGVFAPFSSYGAHAGVAAPGVSIASTYAGGQYAALSGTSMASPHVAGLAALIWARSPSLTADQVRNIIQQTAVDGGPPGRDPQYGYGVINVGAAVRSVQTGGGWRSIFPWWP